MITLNLTVFGVFYSEQVINSIGKNRFGNGSDEKQPDEAGTSAP
jgi:hypothetical protein